MPMLDVRGDILDLHCMILQLRLDRWVDHPISLFQDHVGGQRGDKCSLSALMDLSLSCQLIQTEKYV
jgi:hypothetical protein